MQGFILSFEVEGDAEVMRGFSRFADNVKDLSEPFREIAADFYKGEERQFETEGSYGAGGWQALAPATILQKERAGYPLDILVRSGELKKSLTEEGGANIKEINPLVMRLGTRVPYAIYHQSNKPRRKLPRRPVIMLPEEQKTRWTKILHKWLVQQAKEAF